MAICLFGMLCSVNQSIYQSDPAPRGIVTTYYGDQEIGSYETVQSGQSYYNFEDSSESPCPHIFEYKQENGGWFGEVKLNNLDINKNVTLRIEITVQRTFNGQHSGTLQLTTSSKEALRNFLKRRSLLYRLIFPSQNPLPKLKRIYHNNQLICSGPGDVDPPVTTMTYLASFNVLHPWTGPDPEYISQPEIYPSSHFEQQYESRPVSRPVSRPASRPVQQSQFPIEQDTEKPFKVEPQHGGSFGQSEKVACGIPVLGLVESLVIGGKEVSRGQFPWLVAFYRAGRGNLEFICGGNLVNNKHVVTAAHCIQDKQTNKQREAETGVIYVGKHNLDNWNEKGSQKRGVERFIIHEDWKPFDVRYDADIAIIVMDTFVEYSQYVRPLCIWEFSDDINDVVGQRGILAGWGLNDNFILNSEYPKTIEVPIVSDGTCLRSHTAIAAVSSDRTFCAGGKNGEGPCKGDSGGGLLLKREDRWYLRGLVSSSPKGSRGPCDPKSYAVFTDVAKFATWVRSNT